MHRPGEFFRRPLEGFPNRSAVVHAKAYYDVLGADGALEPFETFTLQRPRNDARRS